MGGLIFLRISRMTIKNSGFLEAERHALFKEGEGERRVTSSGLEGGLGFLGERRQSAELGFDLNNEQCQKL